MKKPLKIPPFLKKKLIDWSERVVPELDEADLKTVFPDEAVNLVYEAAYDHAMREIVKDNRVKLLDFKIALKQMKTATDNLSTAVKDLQK